MESLAEETWDLVIAGTGLVQALLALSLSRSDLKILHVDSNTYYGGIDAGLSLDEAEVWAEQCKDKSGVFSAAQITRLSSPSSKLASSRSYTLSLNPQIVYAQSRFLPSLVSSTINAQLEFLAVGAWWIHRAGKLQRVPSSREDVFADDSLSRRDKIGLMKFLRHVVQEDVEESETKNDVLEGSLQSVLTSNFKISPVLQLPISALALEPLSVQEARIETAVPRIRRHMKSVGYFGPGFGAVLAKYAGNAEIAQVACRACAVGGATYLLGHDISSTSATPDSDLVELQLDEGTKIRSKHLVCSFDHRLGKEVYDTAGSNSQLTQMYHSISIVSSPLQRLFPPTSENGPVPAATMILANDSETAEEALTLPPIYLQIHSEDTGECPSGQCIIYASTLHTSNQTDSSVTVDRLASVVEKFIETVDFEPPSTESQATDTSVSHPEILWSMSYISSGASISEPTLEPFVQDETGRILVFPPRKHDIAFDDNVLISVKAVWEKVIGTAASDMEFMRFEDRSTGQDEE